DHSGAAPALKEATGARLLLSEREVGAVGDDLASVAYLFGQQAPVYEVDETLKEGMVLDIGEWKLRVLETPGHSLGSLCLYEENAKVLFSGDTVFPDGNIGRTDMYGGDTPELVRSIERLTKLDVQTMYPGHMEITSRDVNRQIQMSLRFAKSI
ncbi:MAG: MBL fold metallo-hydrolase, partial [Methanothrix sp.]|nr:MBL fold metallo-hydrolase [Methanothrix sp.]